MRLIDIFESKRKDRSVLKLSSYDELKKYKDKNDVYISFTAVDKIGINPLFKFKTPLGIYTYPLKQIWPNFDHENKKIKVPFAGWHPTIWIIQENCSKFIEDISTSYTNADLKNDIEKIKNIFTKIYDIKLIDHVLYKASTEAFNQSPGGKLWNITRWLANDAKPPSENNLINHFPVRWNQIFRVLGYCGVADKSGSGIIHVNEPIQAIFFTKSSFKVVDKIKNDSTEHNPKPRQT